MDHTTDTAGTPGGVPSLGGITLGLPEPASAPDLRGLLLDYLDFYRSVVAGKVAGLDEGDLRSTRLPSGWTPRGC